LSQPVRITPEDGGSGGKYTLPVSPKPNQSLTLAQAQPPSYPLFHPQKARRGEPSLMEATDGGSGGKYTLPKLFLLGCEKCGSTSLAFALARHPQLRFARCALAPGI
jgi:hypothetical protein